MKIKYTKTLENAIPPVLGSDNNSFDVICAAIGTGTAKDGRLVLEYRSGIEVEIQEGFIGLLIPNKDSFIHSLVLTNGVSYISDKQELIARFKINTDSIPAIYEIGEAFARLIILPIPTVELEEAFGEVEVKIKENEPTTEASSL